MDVSGIPPQQLLTYFPRLETIAAKVLWGTDWPAPGVRSPQKNVAEFRALPLPDASKRRILNENALVFFDLGGAA
jgi:predicted TIM-barrel fold metal-dependent hydrolase